MTAPAKAAPMREDVTQADREAAIAYRINTLGLTKNDHRAARVREVIESGAWDEKPSVRIFTDHRLAHAARPDAGDEDVERVAAGIYVSCVGLDTDPSNRLWSDLNDSTKDNFRRHARAALAAMREGVDRGMVEVPREPTEAMLVAAEAVDFSNEDERASVHNMWNAMLAALEQPR